MAHQLNDNYNIEDICGAGIISLGTRGNWKAYKTRKYGVVFINENMKVDIFKAYTRGKLERVFMNYYKYSDFVGYVKKFLTDNGRPILRIINRKKKSITYLNVVSKNFAEDLISETVDKTSSELKLYKSTQADTKILVREDDLTEFVISAEEKVLAKYITDFAFEKNKMFEKF